jgi:hypothetical protein
MPRCIWSESVISTTAVFAEPDSRGSAAALIEPGAGMSVDHRALLHQEIASEAGSGINLCCDPKVS